MSATMTPASKEFSNLPVTPKLKIKPKVILTIKRPIRDEHKVQPTKTVPKPSKMVSTAGIFKKQRKQAATKKKSGQKSKFTQELDKEMELMGGVKDGMKNARTRIMLKMTHHLNEVHKNHMATHAQGKETDANFLNYIATTSTVLNAPLEKEQIESTVNRNGKLIKEVSEMGKLIENFKNKIEAEKTKLNMNWKKWDEVQRELAQLGAEVFGIGGSAITPNKDEEKGYRREMEVVNAEHSTKLAETTTEIKAIGVGAMNKMKTSEKELNVAAKKEQAKIIAAILEN
ncbi:hypothetical protein B7463_g7654, partial [Scytalidium lignicola]